MLVNLVKWTRYRRLSTSFGIILAVALCLAVALPLRAASGSMAETTVKEVTRATLAPYGSFLRRNARALCGDFTTAAAHRLARYTHATECVPGMEAEFSSGASLATLPVLTGPKHLKVERVVVRDRRATVGVLYYDKGTFNMSLALEKVSGEWQVSTMPLLTVLNGCLPHVRCSKGTHTLLFAIAFPGRVQVLTPLSGK